MFAPAYDRLLLLDINQPREDSLRSFTVEKPQSGDGKLQNFNFMSKSYKARTGDCIGSIAFDHGFFPATIWDHPENASLRRERGEGSVLKEGDIVFIPDLERKQVGKPTEAEHVFRRRGIPEILQLRFLDEEENPRCGIEYVFEIDGALRKGKTNGEGFVKEFIPPNSVRARLTLLDAGGEEKYTFNLGALQPISENLGVRQRLSNLGYRYADESGEPNSELSLAGAVGDFQKDYNLTVTGELDEATRRKIQEAYGA